MAGTDAPLRPSMPAKTPPPLTARIRTVLLPGVLSLLLYTVVALRLGRSPAPRDMALFLAAFALLYGLYLWGWLEVRAKGSVTTVLILAALFRLAMLPAGLGEARPLEALGRDLGGPPGSAAGAGYDTFLLYDNDVWRYLWDGHVLASGQSPYSLTPAEHLRQAEDAAEPLPPLESELWWDVIDNVGFRTHTTVYPPVAQGTFLLAHWLAPGSVLVLKLLSSLFDLVTCLVLLGMLDALGRPRRGVLLYAWNPLVIKEVAGSGHVDALMVMLAVVAVYGLLHQRHRTAHLLLAAATGAKLAAVVLTPLFLRVTPKRTWPVIALAGGAIAWPFLGTFGRLFEGLGVYARDWQFNSGPWAAIRWLFAAAGVEAPELWAHIVTKGLVIGVAVAAVRLATTPSGTVRASFYTLGALTLLHPAVMPWYLIWALPFAVAAGNRSWIVLTGLSLLSYLFYVDQVERAWWLWLEYGVFTAAVLFEWRTTTEARRA